MNERGTAGVEAAVALGLVVSIVSAGLLLSYTAFAHVWLDRAAYEAAVCLTSDARESFCEQRFRKATESALPIGEVTELRLLRDRDEVRAGASFRIARRELIKVRHRLPSQLISSQKKPRGDK